MMSVHHRTGSSHGAPNTTRSQTYLSPLSQLQQISARVRGISMSLRETNDAYSPQRSDNNLESLETSVTRLAGLSKDSERNGT